MYTKDNTMTPVKKSPQERQKKYSDKDYKNLLKAVEQINKSLKSEIDSNKKLSEQIRKCNKEVKKQRSKLKLLSSLRYQALIKKTIEKIK